MAQPVETATDYKHTHKDLGLMMVKHPNGQTDRQTDRRYQTYYLLCFAVDNQPWKNKKTLDW